MLNFDFIGIKYGLLAMKIQFESRYIIWTFDECLSDPIPGMMRMYNALKEGRDASWNASELTWKISFHTEFRDENQETVWLTVRTDGKSYGNYDGIFDVRMGRKNEICDRDFVAEAEFAVDVLLEQFEIFFHLLTSSKLYPCHYPCWWQHEDDDSVHDEADKLAEQYLELDENEVDQLELLYYAEHCVLTEYGEELYRKFDNMMRTHKVPEGWGVGKKTEIVVVSRS